jgi:hypothetical protein
MTEHTLSEPIDLNARRAQRAPAEGVVREYQLLRDTISKRLRRELSPESVLAVSDVLNYLLDEALLITVAEYVSPTPAATVPSA